MDGDTVQDGCMQLLLKHATTINGSTFTASLVLASGGNIVPFTLILKLNIHFSIVTQHTII